MLDQINLSETGGIGSNFSASKKHPDFLGQIWIFGKFLDNLQFSVGSDLTANFRQIPR